MVCYCIPFINIASYVGQDRILDTNGLSLPTLFLVYTLSFIKLIIPSELYRVPATSFFGAQIWFEMYVRYNTFLSFSGRVLCGKPLNCNLKHD